MYTVVFFKDKKGNEPVKDYLISLQEKAQSGKDSRIKLKKIYEYIEILSRNGTMAGEPYIKHIEAGIWELRPLSDRIFFFFWRDNIFILLHQFRKKSQKTPRREIEQAKRNRKEFIERSHSEWISKGEINQ